MTADPGLDRGHQVEPVGREARGKHRHGDHQAPQAARPGVALHHLTVGQDIAASDLKDPARCLRDLQDADEVAKNIRDGDRLGSGVNPARANHDREPLGQGTDHLERKTSGTDDHRRPELRDRDTGGTEGLPRLLSGSQMGRQVRTRISQSAEVDDLLDARPSGCLGEVAGGFLVFPLEIGLRFHAVDQVVRHLHAFQGGPESPGLHDVAAHGFHIVGPGSAAQPAGVAHQTANVVPGFQEAWNQAATDVAGGARHQDTSWLGCAHAACLPIQNRRQSPPEARKARKAYRLAVKNPRTITRRTHTTARASDGSR